MFAYCGNNPICYSDPKGYAYKGIYSQINYCEYEHSYGGLRENYYAYAGVLLCDDTPDLGAVGSVIGRAAASAIDSAASTLVTKLCPACAIYVGSLCFMKTYDYCRTEGLNVWDSFWGAGGPLVVSNSIPYIVGDSIISAVATDVSLDFALDRYIAIHQPSPTEANANKQNHIAQKRALVCVGGAMRPTMFGQLERRVFYGQP